MRKTVYTFLVSPFLLISCQVPDENNETNEKKEPQYYVGWKEHGGAQGQNGKYYNVNSREFRVFEFGYYAKDDLNVFFCGEKISGVDPKTFIAVGRCHAKDKMRCYYGDKPIGIANPANFIEIDNIYSSDGSDIYFFTKPMHVNNVKNFRTIKSVGTSAWSTDGKYYYCSDLKVPSTDLANFTILAGEGGFSKDKNWVYYKDRKFNFNDKGEKVIDTVDAASFVALSHNWGRDKWGYMILNVARQVKR